jgi:hypothetical protein
MATEQPRIIPNWEVDYALYEVVNAIQKGSSPLSIRGVEEGYKCRYVTDFQRHWETDGNPNSWPDAKERILKLAEKVGRLAKMLTILQRTGGGKPADVDPSSAYMAGYFVAKFLCPASSPGVWCMNYYYMEPKSKEEDEVLIACKFGEFLDMGEKYVPHDQPTGGPQ